MILLSASDIEINGTCAHGLGKLRGLTLRSHGVVEYAHGQTARADPSYRELDCSRLLREK